MHDKGSHGDGDPQNTETPLLCWGAGVDGPRQQLYSDVGIPRIHSDSRWALDHLARRDVQQADIAPLMVKTDRDRKEK
jgi:GPI ethanolamine phosphate transferase 1